jgi:hypothetical protein
MIMMYDFVISDFSSQIFKVPHCQIDYSVLKLSTGFAIASLIAWKLTVITAIMIAIKPATKKIHTVIWIWQAKLCNHLFIEHYDNGNAMKPGNANELNKFLIAFGD